MVCVKGIGKDHAKFSPVGEPNSLHLTSDVPREEMVIHFPSNPSSSGRGFRDAESKQSG